jgi:opacity protein-like surface antigen
LRQIPLDEVLLNPYVAPPSFANASIDIFAGPSFSTTGTVSNADLGDGAHATFGTGYQVGAGVGFPVLPGLNLGVTGLYTGGLSPTFTGSGGEQATGSAHAETFLLDTQIFPFKLSFPSTQSPTSAAATPSSPLGFVQPYVDLGLGLSVATMGQLTGHLNGVPTGTGPGETKTDFSWKAGAGVQFDTGVPGLSASLGYDYVRLGNFSTTSTFNLFSGASIMRPPFNVNVSESVVKATLTWHFGAPPPAMPPMSETPMRERQPASLASVSPAVAREGGSAGSVARFTIRFDERLAALTPLGIRALDQAVGAIRAGQRVEIAIEGCGADGPACARRAIAVRQLLAERGVSAPRRFVLAELR